MNTNIDNFALTNQISQMTGKSRNEFTRDDLIDVIIKKGIERITFNYTGIDGKIKELRIPICSRQQAEVILTEGERVDGSSLFKGMIDPGKSDLYVIPVYKTAFINPFDEKSLNMVCRFLTPEGELADFAPDNILAKAAGEIKKKTGMELHALGELEFYLMSDPENRSFPMPKQKGYHASAPYVKSGHILNEMLHHIAMISGNVKYAHNEVGFLDDVKSDHKEINGKMAQQVEIEFLPTPIEDTGDILVLSRWIIRNVAFRHNCVATFVPKLEIGHAGTGMHVHMMLKKDGKNVMVDSDGELSDIAKNVIGGLCHYATSISAFGNMVSASYLRLVPHQEAPTKVCWSAMNRSALVRVPLGWNNVCNLTNIVNPKQPDISKTIDSRQTVELRSPDGSCNSHLLLAAIASAVNWGLTNGKESLANAKNSHVVGNIHDSQVCSDLPELPTSCEESAEILLQHRDLYEESGMFPANVISYIASVLKNENDAELNKRLMSLPDEEKLQESRRIMHRDIHRN